MNRWHALAAGLALALLWQTTASGAEEDALARVRREGMLVIGVEGTYPPYSMPDGHGGLTGFEVELGTRLAERLGVRPGFRSIPWGNMFDALEAGRVDVVMNQVTITPERLKRFDFSIPYTYSGMQMVTRTADWHRFRTVADLAGQAVGVGIGTSYESWLHAHAPQARIRLYGDDPAKFDGLRKGEVDVILINRLAAFNLVRNADGQLASAGQPLAREEAGVALRKRNPALLDAINAALAQWQKDGTLTRLSRKWFIADITTPPDREPPARATGH